MAQIPGGTLSGTVMDPSGAVIPGARINMTAQSTGMILRTLSNEVGSFAFTQLPPDTYSGTVVFPDFRTGKFIYVVSDANSIARLNVTLALGLTTVVEISVQRPPGLKCFSIFGAVKADGTPFTEADCPGGTAYIAPPKPQVPTAPEPATPEVVSVNSPLAAIPTPGQRPVRVGGVVQAGRLIFHPNPVYPAEARNRGIEGVVIVAAVIGVDGHFQTLKIVSSSNPLLETSVLETLQNWTYQPTLLNGSPIEVSTTVTLNFIFNG
jgi:TonB family protein